MPKAHNMSRFLKTLGEPTFLALMREAFAAMVKALAEEVETLGVHTAGDSTALKARRDRGKAPAQPLLRRHAAHGVRREVARKGGRRGAASGAQTTWSQGDAALCPGRLKLGPLARQGAIRLPVTAEPFRPKPATALR